MSRSSSIAARLGRSLVVGAALTLFGLALDGGWYALGLGAAGLVAGWWMAPEASEGEGGVP